jgi:CRISPR/Cas system-associated exonuclease Cas4 (RecB family)
MNRIKYMPEHNQVESATIKPLNRKTTALHVAVSQGYGAIVDCLLETGESVNTQNEYGITALHLASFWGYSAIVKRLLEAGALVDLQDQNGTTAFQFAAVQGYEGVVKRLLKAGAKVNIQDNDGITALYCAAKKGYGEIVDRLLEAGAFVNMQTKDKNIALLIEVVSRYAAMRELSEIANIQDKKSIALYWAAYKGYLYLLDYLLLQEKGNINSRDEERIVEVLLTRRGNLKSLLTFSVRKYCPGVLKLLLRHHVDLCAVFDRVVYKRLQRYMSIVGHLIETKTLEGIQLKKAMQCLRLLYLAEVHGALDDTFNQFPFLAQRLAESRETIARDNDFFMRSSGNQEKKIDYVKVRDWVLLSPQEKTIAKVLGFPRICHTSPTLSKLPPEIMNHIRSYLVSAPLSRHRFFNLEYKPKEEKQFEISVQIHASFMFKQC